jgi:hypothetical protein
MTARSYIERVPTHRACFGIDAGCYDVAPLFVGNGFFLRLSPRRHHWNLCQSIVLRDLRLRKRNAHKSKDLKERFRALGPLCGRNCGQSIVNAQDPSVGQRDLKVEGKIDIDLSRALQSGHSLILQPSKKKIYPRLPVACQRVAKGGSEAMHECNPSLVQFVIRLHRGAERFLKHVRDGHRTTFRTGGQTRLRRSLVGPAGVHPHKIASNWSFSA